MLRNTAKLLAFAAGVMLSGQAVAQASDSETTDASVTLVSPIAVTETASLRFGQVLKGATGTNTVTIDASSGGRSLGGGGDAVLAGGTSGRATYDVTGEDDSTFSIALTSSTINLTDGGTGSLSVALNRSATTGTLSASGTASFGVGGVLTIDNTDTNDLAGDYAGTFEVTAAYN